MAEPSIRALGEPHSGHGGEEVDDDLWHRHPGLLAPSTHEYDDPDDEQDRDDDQCPAGAHSSTASATSPRGKSPGHVSQHVV